MDDPVNEPQPPAQPDVLTVDHHAQAGTCPTCGQALPVASSEPPSTAEETA